VTADEEELPADEAAALARGGLRPAPADLG
jgi:hypothetical protein